MTENATFFGEIPMIKYNTIICKHSCLGYILTNGVSEQLTKDYIKFVNDV